MTEAGGHNATGKTSTAKAVVVEGVHRRFGSLRVLKGLDLEIAKGEAVVLFGANGSGKTTMLRILAGLSRPEAGTVRVLGTRLPGGSTLRRRIGMVAHESWLYGDLSASENLRYYSRLYRIEGNGVVERAIAAVGLEAAAERPARTFSRGMLQRLALARACLHGPELLLLDEPFTGLDPEGAESFCAMLTALGRTETTVLLTTHDIRRGLAVAGRALLLHKGRMAWDSGPELPDVEMMQEVYKRTVGGA